MNLAMLMPTVFIPGAADEPNREWLRMEDGEWTVTIEEIEALYAALLECQRRNESFCDTERSSKASNHR